MRFLETVRDWAGKDAANVDVMAHSMGNLLMWDTVRVHARYVDDGRRAKGSKLVRNIVSNQAAIWEEAFQEEGDLLYRQKGGTPGYSAGPLSETTYTVAQQKIHSWRFWFRQGNKNIVNTSLAGKAYHSFVPTDFALDLMVKFDFNQYSTIGPPAARRLHFNRELMQDATRRPLDVPIAAVLNLRRNRFGADLPSLMETRQAVYLQRHLNQPMGQRPDNPLAAYNYAAIEGGWRREKGFPILRVLKADVRNHSDFIAQPYPQIYRWWDQLLAGGERNEPKKDEKFPPAIAIGQE
jgi:hypothetical protein